VTPDLKTITALGYLLVVSQGWSAPVGASLRPAVQSASGQFAIFDQRTAVTRPLPDALGNPRFVDLEPAFLTVSCERIKGALYTKLGLPNEWRGKIQVTIRPVRPGTDGVAIGVDRMRGNWQYQVSLPQRVERTLFVRTLVQVVLLEVANRSAVEHSAEVPFWLVEGLTQQLLASQAAELILAPPVLSLRGVTIRPTNIEQKENEQLAQARQALRNRPPLTIEELSWPKTMDSDRAAEEAYSGSAQLFVEQLLRLPNGPESLRRMLAGLGAAYNWQTAFLRAYHEQFPNQLALEKWWALQVVYFVGRDPTQRWTAAESWSKLDQALRLPVDIRRSLGDLPARADVTLQAVIRQWNLAQQTTILEAKVRELDLTRRRIAPEFMALTEDYRQALTKYLAQRREGWVKANLWFSGTTPQKATTQVLRQLDALDAKRFALRPKSSENLSAFPTENPKLPR